jgi:hypothetical protein
VKRVSFALARTMANVQEHDFMTPYIDDLKNVIDVEAIKKAGVKIGVDPLGGSGVAYWDVIAKTYGLNIEVVNYAVDPTFSFMTLDKDGKIRMDCSSPWAMASLIGHKDKFDVAVANDPDNDRHGIVCKAGLMNPTTIWRWPSSICLLTVRVGRHRLPSVRRWSLPPSSIGSLPASAANQGWPVASSGSLMVCLMAASVLAVKRVPAPPSCAKMARSGPPTRTASCCAAGGGNPGGDRQGSADPL